VVGLVAKSSTESVSCMAKPKGISGVVQWQRMVGSCDDIRKLMGVVSSVLLAGELRRVSASCRP
jgi:hypothetical protein